jgi:DNA polymerase-3 subunit delta
VARYDVFKLSEAVLAGRRARAAHARRPAGRGRGAVLVHWALAEDIRALKRVQDAMAAGKPLPLALRSERVWGLRERLFERVLPRLAERQLDALLEAAWRVDGIVKGLQHPAGPPTPGRRCTGWRKA